MSEIIASVYEAMEGSGIKEGILFLDEINCVSETLAPSMLQFLQYKTFGKHRVPEGWIIVTAGNPPEYNKSVREFDVVTMDRLKVLEVEADYDAWKTYAREMGIHGAIVSFLELKKEYFYHIETDRMLAAVMALGLYEGAYVAEIVRGSVESVPPGQWDAARALGFSRRQSLRLVILPQAARIAMPPLAGQTISAFKDSALASLISLPELTFQSLEVMAVSQMTFEIWISAGALYLLIGLACAALGRWLERRCARHERPSALRGVRV